MNTKQETKFETVDDMVRFVTENVYRGTVKYNLRDQSSMKWIDEAAGRAWDNERDSVLYISFGDPGRKAYDKRIEALEKRMPAQEKVVKWLLVESSSSYHSHIIHLSTELGEMLDTVWKKGPVNRWSSFEERKGAVTIPGLLKRLGRTDASEKIATAKENVRLEHEKRSRNHDRKQAREAAEKLYKIIAENNGSFVDFIELMPERFMPALAHLKNLQDEE